MPLELRRLGADELPAAAAQHRAAGALIPGYDPEQQPAATTLAAYRQAWERGAFWGAYDGDALVGHLALEPGWIEHLYVAPDRQGEGIGRALLALAQGEQDDLQLYTYRANARARRLYERAGFVVAEEGVDPANGVANVRYRWRR